MYILVNCWQVPVTSLYVLHHNGIDVAYKPKLCECANCGSETERHEIM